MFFFAVTRNCFTDKPYISCGCSNVVDVDGRYSLNTQYNIALDHLYKRIGDDLIGIVCIRNLKQTKNNGSVRVENGTIYFDNLGYFDSSLI